MQDAANLDSVGCRVDEEKPVVTDTEPQFSPFSPEAPSHRLCPIRKAMEGGENAHGRGLVQSAHIDPGRFGPDDPLHSGSL